MRAKIFITFILIGAVSILFLSGFCQLDTWSYILCCMSAFLFLLILWMQSKKIEKLYKIYEKEGGE